MDLTNLNNAKVKILNSIVNAAKKNLDTPQDRQSVSASWKKTGGDWKPINASKSTKKRKISNTGSLSSSIKYKIENNKLIIETLGYGKYIDLGRKKGEEPPTTDIKKWATQKGIKDATFQIQRKLKFFGMPPTYFLTGPVEEMIPKVGEILTDAYLLDLENALQNN